MIEAKPILGSPNREPIFYYLDVPTKAILFFFSPPPVFFQQFTNCKLSMQPYAGMQTQTKDGGEKVSTLDLPWYALVWGRIMISSGKEENE